jgi:hypothetical protein
MEPRRSFAPQEVPEEFAVLLRRLRDEGRNPVLNALLAASRAKAWRTSSLAKVIEMNPAAVNKRIERARRALRLVESAGDPGTPAVREQQEIRRELEGIRIPEAPRVQTTIGGKRLEPEKIDELLAMQRDAEKVNGAMSREHRNRRVSERLSAELNRLIEEEGFTPYYLARVLGRSHRAITSRLERHHFREPCPSVAGTPSGEYRNRKIGDPVQADA